MSGFGAQITQVPTAGHAERNRETAPRRPSPAAGLYAAPKRQRGATLSMLVLCAVLYLGWRNRVEQHLTAESGLGYLLGIVGGVLMLLLLLYPLRKRISFMRRMGAAKHWFRVHMILGVIGPALILFHANFSLGSLNSRIALISMLLVAGSGLVGRYIYSKIHHGLYGRRMNLAELREIAEDSGSRLGSILSSAPELQERLRAYEQSVIKPPRTVLHSAVRIIFTGIWTRLTHTTTRRKLKRALKIQAAEAGWSRREKRLHAKEGRQYLSAYFNALRKVVGFHFYEQLFALWHVLHVPLFIVLVITSVAHVFAVHMY